MKLLSTIAAVLISISAFSQDLIEYNESTYSLNGEKVSLEYKKSMTGFNPDAESMFEFSLGGTFSRNGEVLTMEQIQSLTKRYNVGGSNLRRGNRFDRMYENQNYRITNNIGNFVVGSAAGFIGVPFVLFGGYVVHIPIIGAPFLGAGTVLCVVSHKAFSRTTSYQMILPRRDKQFNKVAEKLNQELGPKDVKIAWWW